MEKGVHYSEAIFRMHPNDAQQLILFTSTPGNEMLVFIGGYKHREVK